MAPRFTMLRFIALLLTVSVLAACAGRAVGTSENSGGVDSPPTPGASPGGFTYVRSYGSSERNVPSDLAVLPDGGLAVTVHSSEGFGDRFLLLEADGTTRRNQLGQSNSARWNVNYEFGAVVGPAGAVFVGDTERATTGSDVIVRMVRPDGAIGWEVTLDAGDWGGLPIESRSISDFVEAAEPVVDASGAWQGVWVLARSRANVVRPDADGNRIVVGDDSVTVWYLDRDGAVVSRTRILETPRLRGRGVNLSGVAVLDTGSLAILVSARVLRETERVILRIHRDGSVADTSVPADDFRKLVSVSGALLAVGEESVARVDINGRRMDWQTPTRIGWRGVYSRKVQAVSVQRAGIAQIVLAGDNIIERYALADGRLLGSCNLSPGYPVLDMIGDASGNVRALVSRPARAGEGGRRGMLSMDLRDDCADPTAAAVDLGARLLSYGVVSLERLSTAQFSAYGTHVHEASGYRARRTDVRAVTEFEILHELRPLRRSFESLAIGPNSEVAVVGLDGVHRFNSAGDLLREDELPGLWRIAGDADGTVWATGEPTAQPSNVHYCSGVTRVRRDGQADCISMAEHDLTGWNLTASRDHGVWAASTDPEQPLVQFMDGRVVAHTTLCGFRELDVGPDGSRVGIVPGPVTAVCRERPDGQTWRVTLRDSMFDGALRMISGAEVRAIAAADGGVVVVMSVAQTGPVPGLRSSANILGDRDIALLKLDSSGRAQWLRVYGAARDETAHDVVRMPDGGFAISGTSDSFDAVTPGSDDVLLIRIGPDGHVARTGAGADACQACLGTLSGSLLREIVTLPENLAGGGSVTLQFTTSAIVTQPLNDFERADRPFNTDATSCRGDATNVQEAPVTDPEPTPGPDTGAAPVAQFSWRSIYGGPPVSNRNPARFDASASTSADGIARYQWDFENDGTFDAEGRIYEHLYPSRGSRVARLRVTATNGRTAEATANLTVDPSPEYYVRVRPVHADNEPNNSIEQVDGRINCQNRSDGSVQGHCFETRSNGPAGETRLRARAAVGSAFSAWIGCDSTPARAEGPPDCIIAGDLDGRERQVEARFVSLPRVDVTVVMTGETASRGSVYSIGGTIDCPTRCTAPFVNGSDIQFQVIAGRDGDFLRFEGCDSAADGLCQLRVGSEPRTIRAVFR